LSFSFLVATECQSEELGISTVHCGENPFLIYISFPDRAKDPANACWFGRVNRMKRNSEAAEFFMFPRFMRKLSHKSMHAIKTGVKKIRASLKTVF